MGEKNINECDLKDFDLDYYISFRKDILNKYGKKRIYRKLSYRDGRIYMILYIYENRIAIDILRISGDEHNLVSFYDEILGKNILKHLGNR